MLPPHLTTKPVLHQQHCCQAVYLQLPQHIRHYVTTTRRSRINISASCASSRCSTGGLLRSCSSHASRPAISRVIARSTSSTNTSMQMQRVWQLQQLLEKPLVADSNSSSSDGSQFNDGVDNKVTCDKAAAASSSDNKRKSNGFGASSASAKASAAGNKAKKQQQQQQQQQRVLLDNDAPCPCQSLLLYKDCCQPFLSGATVPRSAPELVRARITAAKTGSVTFLVSCIHPDSSKTLGGQRDMTSRSRRICAHYKANKFDVLGMAHCPGDLAGSWLVLYILQATAGEYAGTKVPIMEMLVKEGWQQPPSTGFSSLWGLGSKNNQGAGQNGDTAGASSSSKWMFLKTTNELPENGGAEAMIALLQLHVPEALGGEEGSEQQQRAGMMGWQFAFRWGAPWLNLGPDCRHTATATAAMTATADLGARLCNTANNCDWYVDLLKPAAEPLISAAASRSSNDSQQQQQHDGGGMGLQDHMLLVPPGVFVMDAYLASKQ